MYDLNGFFGLNHLTAPVITAAGTRVMEKLRRTAVRAFGYLRFSQTAVIPGAALPRASLGMFSFGIRHDVLCSLVCATSAQAPACPSILL